MFGNKYVKQLPELIFFYATKNINVFIETGAKILGRTLDETTIQDLDSLSDENISKCNNALVLAVAQDLFEDASVEYGNSQEFHEKVKHIIDFIHDPNATRCSLVGERPTSKVYDVYEMIFGKYHDDPELNILMVYEICYYLLRKKSPNRKEQLQAIESFNAAFATLYN